MTSSAGADFKEDYVQGLEAFDEQRWGEVARLMQRAIGENTKEKAVRIYGMDYRPYLPYYYLGVARAELDSCGAALTAWRSSEERGVILKQKKEHSDLEARRSNCLAPEVAKAEAEIQRARESARRVTDLSGEPTLRDVWSAGFAGEQSRAAKLLDSAVAGLDSARGSGNVDGIQEAARLAAQAQRDLAALYEQAEQRRGELQTAFESGLRTRREEIDALTPAARKLLGDTGSAGLATALQRERTALDRALDSASGAASVRSPAELDRLRQELSSATNTLKGAVDEYRAGEPLRGQIRTLAAEAESVLGRAGQLPGQADVLQMKSNLESALAAAATAPSLRSATDLGGVRQRLATSSAALKGAVDEYQGGEPTRREIESLAAGARSVLAAAQQVPGVQSQMSALEGALEESLAVRSMRSPTDLSGLRQRLLDSTAALQRAVDEYGAGTPVRQQIERLTGEARSVLDRADSLPADAGLETRTSAVRQALNAASQAASVRSETELEALRRRLGESTAALEGAIAEYGRMTEIRRQIPGLERAARNALERARPLPRDAGVGRQQSAVEQALEAASGASAVRSAAELDRVRRGLGDTTAALERALDAYARRPPPVEPPEPSSPIETGPPRPLRDAVRAYFDGEFERTLEILGGASFSDRRVRVQAHLFRAAAQHALFRMGGRQDAGLQRAAKEAVQACLRLDAGFVPDSEAFSPAFLSFFRDGGA